MHQDLYQILMFPKMLQPKGLYLVRPAMQQYLSTKEELDEASK
jgi:NADPH2:quinone reductase